MIGGFWIDSEIKSVMGGSPFTGLMTLGYDPGKGRKFVQTIVHFICQSLNTGREFYL